MLASTVDRTAHLDGAEFIKIKLKFLVLFIAIELCNSMLGFALIIQNHQALNWTVAYSGSGLEIEEEIEMFSAVL